MEISTSSSPENDRPLPLRMKSLILRAYPWSTGIIAHPSISDIFNSESGFHGFATQFMQSEAKFFASFSYDAMAVRQLLHCGNETDNDVASQMASASHRQQMLDLFIFYRILDLLALTKAIPALPAVPCHIKAENLGCVDKPGWQHMNDWKKLLDKFQNSMSGMLQALPSGSKSYVGQIIMLGHLLRKNVAYKILLNVQIAAMHLADIMGGVDFLDTHPPLFLQKYLDNIISKAQDNAEIDPVAALIQAYQPNQLRLPLCTAVMISPLCLLAPIQLYSSKWDRHSLFLTSKGLGNCKPPLLVAVETQLMAALFRLARLETDLETEMLDLSSWLKSKMPEITGEVPDSRAWFESNSSVPNMLNEKYIQIAGEISPVWNLGVLQVLDGDATMPKDGYTDDYQANMEIDVLADDKMDIEIAEEESGGMDDGTVLSRRGVKCHQTGLRRGRDSRDEGDNDNIVATETSHVDEGVDVNTFFDIKKVSLVHEIKLKKYFSSCPISAYDPDGRETSITFASHSQKNITRLHDFADALKASYISRESVGLDPLPPHIGKPEASVFHVTTEAKFDQLSTQEVLEILSQQCIVITDRVVKPLKFDENGLSTLSTLSTVIPVQDQSCGLDKSGTLYNDHVLQGTLQQLLDCSKMERGREKILNALQLPMPEEGLGSNPFSTETVAWCGTKGWRGCNRFVLPPTADIRWGHAATTGALQWWNIDSDGFGSYIDVKAGMKWWIVARPKKFKIGSSMYDFSEFAWINLFTRSDYKMEDPCTAIWDLEAVLLTPGTRLIMPPNLPHSNYTPEHVICHGGHFYAISTIQNTMFGLVHSFVAGNLVTNMDHIASRLLLCRMAYFYHGAFVLGLAGKKDLVASGHIPDLREFKSFLDIVTLCNLIILMNALDGRTYQAPQSESDSEYPANSIPLEERLSYIYARGKCIELLNWICGNYVLEDPDTKERDTCFPMMVAYFRQQTSAIKAYKYKAEKDSVRGSETTTHCSADQLANQLDMAIDVFPETGNDDLTVFRSKVSTSLAWDGIMYDVVCNGNLSSKKEEDFMYYGNLGATRSDNEFLAHLRQGGNDVASTEQGDQPSTSLKRRRM